MPTPESPNPYESPAETSVPEIRPTRWRIVAVALLIIFGVIVLIAAPISLIVAHSHPVELGGGITPLRVLGVLLSALFGILWIASGILCWRARWLLGCATFALGLLAAFVSNLLLKDLGL